jgi:hypothetical protein
MTFARGAVTYRMLSGLPETLTYLPVTDPLAAAAPASGPPGWELAPSPDPCAKGWSPSGLPHWLRPPGANNPLPRECTRASYADGSH